MGSPLYCRPSDIVTPSATMSVPAGTADSRYPVSNLIDGFAHTVSKSTGTTITFRATFGAPVTLEAVACINTNATAIQLTNGAGLNVAIAVPTTPEDGYPLDPWKDLRGLGSTSSTVWSVALTGPSGVGLGELLLVQTLRSLDLDFSNDKRRETHASNIQTTDYGVRLKYGMGVRQRSRVGTPWGSPADSVMADMLSLDRDAKGALRQFLLIPDSDVNDALYVDLTTDLREFSWPSAGVETVQLEFTEAQKGLAL